MTDFSMGGISKRKDFPKLQIKEFSNYDIQDPDLQVAIPSFYYNYFGAFYGQSLYFISCNPNYLVTKFSLRQGGHRTIANSKIINNHYSQVTGIQVGHFFWIMDGYMIFNDDPFESTV